MADKGIRHLKRAELIEIIYELQNSETQLQKENAALKQQLQDRTIKLEQAGSIAEAALKLNDVFEAAQAAANQYLDEIQRMHATAAAELAQQSEAAQ